MAKSIKKIQHLSSFEVPNQIIVHLDKITVGFTDTTYRVQYGAEIHQCADLESAWIEYKYCVEHAMECGGHLQA